MRRALSSVRAFAFDQKRHQRVPVEVAVLEPVEW
jgi:hypothetical protein